VVLRTLDLDDAAALLGVSPETLLAWEARYGFPSSDPTEPRYNELEVLALRASLAHSPSISSAMAQARERLRRRRAPTSARLGDHRDGGLAS
jgi:MerR family transcriptional regulator, light-induced transcriptional regulator